MDHNCPSTAISSTLSYKPNHFWPKSQRSEKLVSRWSSWKRANIYLFFCQAHTHIFVEVVELKKGEYISVFLSSAQIYICLFVKSTNYKTNLSLEVPGNTRGSVLVATLEGVVHREDQLQALDFQIDCFKIELLMMFSKWKPNNIVHNQLSCMISCEGAIRLGFRQYLYLCWTLLTVHSSM